MHESALIALAGAWTIYVAGLYWLGGRGRKNQ